jgi:hypothetical protein
METSGVVTDGDTRRLYDPRAGLRGKQENEAATLGTIPSDISFDKTIL